jgi:hypothetical protein
VTALKTEYHILNLGCGVQSTTLYLLACGPDRELTFDYAIFADTQAEPKSVYRHLEWLKAQDGPPILTGTKGSLKMNLLRGQNGRGGMKRNGDRFASIPAFTAPPHDDRPAEYEAFKEAGRVSRQCTRDYKTDVVTQIIRREILGLAPRKRVPKSVRVFQYLGISVDEMGRAGRIRERFAKSTKWSTPVFPLIDRAWTRKGCIRWLEGRVPHETPRSACTFCPFKDDTEWADMKANDPDSWAEAVEVDNAIRLPTSRCSERLGDKLYLHRQCIPLEMVDLSDPKPAKLDQFSLFDCLGMCGN